MSGRNPCVFKCLLVAALVFSVLPKAVIRVYLLFICASLFFTIGRLTIIPLLVPGNRLISFNALNERVAIAGAVASPFIVGWTITQIGKRAALGMAGLLFHGRHLRCCHVTEKRCCPGK